MKIAVLVAMVLATAATVTEAANNVMPCSKPWSLKGSQFEALFTAADGPASTCLPIDAPKTARLIMPNGEVRAVPGHKPVTCGEDGICALGKEFYGSAPKGNYVVAAGWYMGVDTAGNPVSYANGTGPGFNGKRQNANTLGKREPGEKFHAVCPINDSEYCTVDTLVGFVTVKLANLPTIGIPALNEADVTANGGNCDSLPMCYDKNGIQIGVNADMLPKK
ncbi:hypothetical protein [Pseudomonas pseudonitroreducens]|uniref:hypothetical protein n=1 Tax=Pseudomonas pseudonitroreducens TaxID=2892326 RepID=UPI001F1C391D|nr:hypothetical protein [Pseudomonas pseudonitroreducens]